MAVIPVQNVPPTGLINPTGSAASAGGDKVQPGAGVVLLVANNNASACTVTIDSKRASNYGDDVNLGGSVPGGGGQRFFALVDESRLAGADGYADITYSVTASVTVTALRLPV